MRDHVPWDRAGTALTDPFRRPSGVAWHATRTAPPKVPVVLVTGASSGIGSAVAARLAAAGRCELLLNGRDAGRLTSVATRTGGVPLPGDLSSPQACRELAEGALDLTGRVDVLVAGAGVGWAGSFTEMPPEAIDELLAVNLGSTVHLVRALLPAMVRHGHGRVVLVASIAGAVGVGDEAVYSATKAALCTFAESLRYEVRHRGVRVSVVLPGAVDTPFFARRGRPYTRSVPRPVPPERVAEAVYRVVASRREEVFVPRWLRLPARLHGVAPGLFRRLAARLA